MTSPHTASTIISIGNTSVPFQSYTYFEKKKQKVEEDDLENYKTEWDERMRAVLTQEVPEPCERVRDARSARKDKFELRRWEVCQAIIEI